MRCPPPSGSKRWLYAVKRREPTKIALHPRASVSSPAKYPLAFNCAFIDSVPLRCHHYEHSPRLQRHLGARAAACSSAARHQLRHRVAGRGRPRVPQERRLRDTMSERAPSLAAWRRRRPSGAAGERRGCHVPRVPRVDAAAACVRVAGVRRGWLLRGLRRVRSVRVCARPRGCSGC